MNEKYKPIIQLRVSLMNIWIPFGKKESTYSMGIKVGASQEEIKKAIRLLILKHLRSVGYHERFKDDYRYSVRLAGRRIVPKTQEEKEFPGPSWAPNYFRPINIKEFL